MSQFTAKVKDDEALLKIVCFKNVSEEVRPQLKLATFVNICDKVFKNGQSKICERQPLKTLK